jgi:hypothetical protein
MGFLSFREFLQIAFYCGDFIGEDNNTPTVAGCGGGVMGVV